MTIHAELSDELLKQSENNFVHSDYSKEMSFYNAVKNGNLDAVKILMTPLTGTGLGKLSDNPLNNMRYHFIVSVAMIIRICMEGGLPSETAYTLSDLYIRRADKIHNRESIMELHRKMIFDFTERMQKIQKPFQSKTITRAIEFINTHIRKAFTLSDVAEAAEISPCYLSTQFKKETGQTITAYTQKMRIEEAKNMLRFGEMDFIDISEYLCFSSQSHFTAVFKRIEGMTPKTYRDRYYGKEWEKEKAGVNAGPKSQ